jgi:hypothetical protein
MTLHEAVAYELPDDGDTMAARRRRRLTAPPFFALDYPKAEMECDARQCSSRRTGESAAARNRLLHSLVELPRATSRHGEEDQSHADRARSAQALLMVLDSATYRAIEGSEFLRAELAPFEARTTVRTDRTYTGLYLYGIHTDFEFFDQARETARGLGDSGLAFGVDEPGALRQLQEQLAPEFPVEQTTITRQLGDEQIPWFLMMTPENVPASSPVSIWFMEVRSPLPGRTASGYGGWRSAEEPRSSPLS